MKKIMNIVLSIFVIACVVDFFDSITHSIKFNFDKIKNISANSDYNKKILKKVDNQVENYAVKNLKRIIYNYLLGYKLKAKKIEIFMDKNDEGSIVIIKCKIYISSEYDYSEDELRANIKRDLHLEAEIIEV